MPCDNRRGEVGTGLLTEEFLFDRVIEFIALSKTMFAEPVKDRWGPGLFSLFFYLGEEMLAVLKAKCGNAADGDLTLDTRQYGMAGKCVRRLS